MDDAVHEMNEIRHQTDNTIRIALTSPLIWNQFFQEFQLSYPDIRLDSTVISLDELNSSDFKYDFLWGMAGILMNQAGRLKDWEN